MLEVRQVPDQSSRVMCMSFHSCLEVTCQLPGEPAQVRLVLSPHTRSLLTGVHRGWGEHLRLGTNLIIDHFRQDAAWSREILLVGVFCSVGELERREASRADGRVEGRPAGLARRSSELCHGHGLDYAESVEAIIAALC